jgi:hypothetical protein
LWNLIERGATIDMAPYRAENVARQDRWWSPGRRIVYHLHLHKCMGSTVCAYFRTAAVANPENNCNVPDAWWWNRSQPHLHYQYGAYIGATRVQMRHVHKKIRDRGWAFVASEGSLELEPIFGAEGPYYYTTILREPVEWVTSMWRYDTGQSNISLDTYLAHMWGTPDFFTRRLCGVGCVRTKTLTLNHFLRAKSMLDHFDLVMAQDMRDTAATARLLRKALPALHHPFPKAKNVGHYQTPALSSSQMKSIRDKTAMDKVLYEYAKVLHGKVRPLLHWAATD